MAENYGSLEGVLDAHDSLEGTIDNQGDMSGEIQFGGGGSGRVKDVQVDDVSVVDENGVAKIDLTDYAKTEDVYDKQTIDMALEGKANLDDIPTELADLQDDSEHRLVTDAEKAAWNSSSEQVQSDWAQNDNTKVDYIKNKPSNLVQDANYVHTDNNYDSTDKGKVDALGTASTKNVPTSGDAGNNEVVLGNDSRLTDARPASDVNEWAKALTKPTYQYSEIQNTPTLGTAAAKDYATSVIDGSTDLVTGDAVHDAIDNAVSGAYKHAGTKTCAELTSSLLVKANAGNVYNMTDSGTTTADFIEGAGLPIRIGDNVGVAKIDENTYKFDLLSGFIDTSNFITKSATSGLVRNDGSIDTNSYATVSQIPDISGKADKSEMSVTDGTGTDADKTTIQLKLGTSATVLKTHQDISGKADKSEMSISTSGDKTTIQLKNGTSAQVLNAHQSISGKADKVSGATSGNFAGLDANGNLTDSGHKHSDYLTQHQDISGKADKVTGATNGNLAKLDANGNLADGGWSSDKTTTSASGNPISISGLKSDQLAVNPIITFEPIQSGSGTPSPSNIRAISGYDKVEVGSYGSNIFGGETFADSIVKAVNNTSGATKGSDSDGKYVSIISGSIVDNKIFTNDVKFKENTQYSLILKAKKSNTDRRLNLVVVYTDGTSQELTKPTASTTLEYFVITTTANKTIKNICTGWQAGTSYLYYEYCGIFEGTKTTSDYQNPIIATSISESLGQTVYGATWNPRTGEFTVDRVIVDLGDLDWAQNASYTDGFTALLSDSATGNGNKLVCSIFDKSSTSFVWASFANYPNNTLFKNYGNQLLYLKANGYASATDLKNTIAGQKLVYLLATPFTIQLTPHELTLLKTYAYASTNGSNIQLSYHNGEMASLGDVSQVAETMNILADLDLGEIISEENVTTTYFGTVTFYKLRNGLKAIKISDSSISSSMRQETSVVPLAYRPTVNATKFMKTWTSGTPRSISVLTNGTLYAVAASEAGISGLELYF